MSGRAWVRLSYYGRSRYPSQRRALHDARHAGSGACQTDWNLNDELFKFTRGRFIVDEETLRAREVRFDMNELAKVAVESIGASQCIAIKKYPDSMLSKVYLLCMNDGRQVFAKVPNSNAGVSHYTTASEVATMDFARNVMDTPVPRVHTWNSRAELHPVSAEFIIMDKVEGVQLSQVWDTIKLPEKLQVLLALTRLQTRWLSVSFSHYGSLYYAGDTDPLPGSYYVKGKTVTRDSKFTLGPATGKDWSDAGRSTLHVERGPWFSVMQYLQAISTRETKAIHSLKPPKQIAMFCGPKLYQPNIAQKLFALEYYNQILNYLIPPNTAITKPRFWHNDLHGDNVFVNPKNPQVITNIIDWQSCHISPLFSHNPDPGFPDWDGVEPETLDLVPQPKLQGLSPEERSAAFRKYSVHNLFIGWRKLMRSKNPALYQAVKFRKTAAYGLIFLANHIFEYGEAHLESLLVDLKHTWKELPGVPRDVPFPFHFSDAEIERIKRACDGAVAGTELVQEVKETLGELWPDKGLIEHERYDECKAALDEIRDQILDQLADTEEERAEYRRLWPFD
ncbi:phosphotransferase enzyme family protein [Aspergillus stella-maris]|uniref:phosphotransferase enzyme family protein n=1 Tax=Aspergillus stella-maris TaxID=1810926 RepID=UPI003CCD0B3F